MLKLSLSRLVEIVLSVFVFWFGLSSSSVDNLNFSEGNFNTPFVRLSCLGLILALQVLMMWNFVLFQFKKMRENKSTKSKPVATTRKSKFKIHFSYFNLIWFKWILNLIARSATKGEVSESDAVESDLDNSKLKTN